MNGVITCSVKEAKKLLKHMKDEDIITLTILIFLLVLPLLSLTE